MWTNRLQIQLTFGKQTRNNVYATGCANGRNNDSDVYRENVTLKVKSRCFKLYHAYSISFNSTNVGNFFWSWILKDCIELEEKKKKVVVLRSRPPQNVKLGIFTSYSKWRQKNVQKSVMHVQSCCFANLNQLRFCSSLWRCPSSLLKGEHSVAMLGQCCNCLSRYWKNHWVFSIFLNKIKEELSILAGTFTFSLDIQMNEN